MLSSSARCVELGVIALSGSGKTLKQTSQRRPWKAMQDSWSMTTASPMRDVLRSSRARIERTRRGTP